MSTKEFINHLYSPTVNSKSTNKTNFTTGRQVEQQSTQATTLMQSPTAFKTSNTFGSAAKQA